MKKFKVQFEEVLTMVATIEAEGREQAQNKIEEGDYDHNAVTTIEENREFRDLCEIQEVEDES